MFVKIGTQLYSARRGGVAVITALALVPLIGVAGVAIDGARAWLLHSRLTAAVNAAAIAGARNVALAGSAMLRPQLEEEMRGMFWANFCGSVGVPGAERCPLRQRGFLGAVIRDEDVRVSFHSSTEGGALDEARIAVAARLPTTLSRVLGLLPGLSPLSEVRVADEATARRTDRRLEVSLVLDVTGSMGRNYRSNSTGAFDFDTGTNIHALRVAARDLVEILFQGSDGLPSPDNPRELFVAVVPYTTTVNIGRHNDHLVDFSAIQPMSSTDANRTWATTFGRSGRAAYGLVDPRSHPSNPLAYRNYDWRGCIEARSGDVTPDDYERPPSVAGPFRPFFYPSTLQDDGTPHTINGQPIRGDNDWIPDQVAGLAPSGPASPYAITEHWQWARENFAVGPNLGCPQDEILPLSPNRQAVLQKVERLLATHRGGTMINIGLQAGWWTLSPLWHDVWNLPSTEFGPVPAPYARLSQGTQKAIVLMTDGRNEWFDFPQGAPGRCNQNGGAPASGLNRVPGAPNVNVPPFLANSCPTGADQLGGANADYTGYGRLRGNPFGWTSVGVAQTQLNNRMLQMCNALREAGITVYTVTFGLDPGRPSDLATMNLFRDCASDPSYFYNSPSRADLIAAFQDIARRLVTANVRLMPKS